MNRIPPASVAFWMGEEIPPGAKPLPTEIIRGHLARLGVDADHCTRVIEALQAQITSFQTAMFLKNASATPGEALEQIEKVSAAAAILAALIGPKSESRATNAVNGLVDRSLALAGSEPVTKDLIWQLDRLRIALHAARRQLPKPQKGGDMYQDHKALARSIIDLFRAERLPIEARENGLLGQVVRHCLAATGLTHNNPDRLLRALLK
jgi:hypothetical protein